MKAFEMDLYSFVASAIGSLAWPAVAVTVALALRRRVLELLSPQAVTRLAVTKTGLEVTRELSDAISEANAQILEAPEPQPSGNDEIIRIAEISPVASILTSAGRFEGELRELLGLHDDRRTGLQYYIHQAALRSLLSESETAAANRLAEIRNEIALSKTTIHLTKEDAIRFDETARRLSMAVSSATRMQEQ